MKLTDELKRQIVDHIVSGRPPAKRKPGMTWGEFKAAVEAAGVKDDTETIYIDWRNDDQPRVWFAAQDDGSSQATVE